jgi:hypothetical protein
MTANVPLGERPYNDGPAINEFEILRSRDYTTGKALSA